MAIIPALMPVIAEVTLAQAAASVSLTVPSRYEILFFEWHHILGDDNTLRELFMRLNSDTGNNYDYSRQQFGTASSTLNGQAQIRIGEIADADGNNTESSGYLVIFNRSAQEKVLIGVESKFANAGGSAEDSIGYHLEGKWRNTSDAITSVSIYAAAGNIAANSRFVLRGLRTTGAPALGSQDIMQFIGSATISSGVASVTLPAIPSGYGMLLLFWHYMDIDNTGGRRLEMRFNGDSGGNYDWSSPAFGTASSTTNAAAEIVIGNVDGDEYKSNGFVTIFNRKSQEKVVIGTECYVVNSGGNDNDVFGQHTEAKWRNTSDEISSILLQASVGKLDEGKFWLIGVKIP